MFESSAPFAFFEYFRIPCTVGTAAAGSPYRQLWVSGRDGVRLAWAEGSYSGDFGRYRLRVRSDASARDGRDAGSGVAGRDAAGRDAAGRDAVGRNAAGLDAAGRLDGGCDRAEAAVEGAGMPIFARVVPSGSLRAGWGTGWRPIADITDETGTIVESVWRDDDGNVLLPFDPGEVMWRFWSEHYQPSPGLRSLLVRTYYALRPVIPRPLQIALRRAFIRVQEQAPFPAFPVEPVLHDFYAWMFDLVTTFAGDDVPWLSPWPGSYRWALVLTHDVETADGIAAMDTLRDIERATGHVSSWNFVPERYETPSEITDALKAEGCEVGVHGLRHDGRDLASARLLRRRLPAMRRAADRWGSAGFRAPATQRTWEFMPQLGFDYDSSYHDTAPYEPRPGGSCSYLPYFVGSPGRPGDMVELPITLPMDHTLFAILRRPDAEIWLSKAAHVRDHGGMVLALTHPDYAHDPRVTDGYRRLLDATAADPTAWRALPGEVASWWQRRAISTVERAGEGWAVCGPAAGEATVNVATRP